VSDNAERFTGRVRDYDRYRQRYPAQAILERLRTWCGLEAWWRVADIGAGTGMLAEVFLQDGYSVTAVEPNTEMRSACELLHERWPRLEVVDASAEATTLAAQSVEMVAAGRAFHWFDRDRALEEFRRIAKPGGWLVLVSQGRAHDAAARGFGDQAARFEELAMRLGTDYGYVRAGYRVHENLHELFYPGCEFYQEQMPGTQELEWESFRGQTMSLSFVPQTEHAHHGAFERELRAMFDEYARDGVLTVPTTCFLTVARLSYR
jgi:SAM-dependent methyltransferase